MAYLLAKDTVNGAEGNIVVTRNGRNYVIAGMRNIRPVGNIQSEKMRVVGTRKIQDKSNGVELIGTGNIYYGFDMFRDMVLNYINTGVLEEFDIQTTNNDPATSIGSQTIAYYGCHLTGEIPLSILNSEETMMNYDFNFAYTSVQKLQSFNEPTNYGN